MLAPSAPASQEIFGKSGLHISRAYTLQLEGGFSQLYESRSHLYVRKYSSMTVARLKETSDTHAEEFPGPKLSCTYLLAKQNFQGSRPS